MNATTGKLYTLGSLTMKHLRATIAAFVLAALAACSTSSLGTPSATNPETPDATHILGLLEVTVDLRDQSNPTGTATFNPIASSAGGLQPQAISVSGNETSQIKLERQKASFFDAKDQSGTKTRYLSSTFDIANFGPRAFKNLNFIATATSTTKLGTMFTDLTDEFGNPIRDLDTLPDGSFTYRGIKPTHGMMLGANGRPTVIPEQADLQYFTPTEASNVQTRLNRVYGGLQVLEYGFTARNYDNGRKIFQTPTSPDCLSTLTTPPNGYTMVTNSPKCFMGQVTFAFKVPFNPTGIKNPYVFSAVYVVADESMAVVSQSLEEQGQSQAAGLSVSSLAGFNQVRTLGGTASDFLRLDALKPLCRVKTAVKVYTPVKLDHAFLGPNAIPASSGSLDGCFGSGGKVITSMYTNYAIYSGANAVAIQADGKIVAAGTTNQSGFALMRYNPDGSLDTSFDGDGRVVTGIGYPSASANAIVIQADGKIVAAGEGVNIQSGGVVTNIGFVLARYNLDGSLDTSFDSDGIVTTNFGPDTGARAVAIQTDGKIVAAGRSPGGFTLARYNSDGSLDASFDGDGKVATPTGTFANAVAIQADGKIIAAGGNNSGGFTLMRYNPNGSLDISFDGDGIVTTNITLNLSDMPYAVVIQADGKIVAAGRSYNGSYDFALVRYNPDGSLDNSFNGNGKVTTDIGSSLSDVAYAVAIQADGKIVAAGTSNNGIALARYNPDGSLDTGFGGNGKITTNIGSSWHSPAVVIQADGKIVAAGGETNSGLALSGFALMRFYP